MSSIFVNRKEFQNYKAVSHVTSYKQYKLYQELCSKDERLELSIYDLSKIDDVPIEIVKQRCGKV